MNVNEVVTQKTLVEQIEDLAIKSQLNEDGIEWSKPMTAQELITHLDEWIDQDDENHLTYIDECF